jgi:hypothetical protein
MKTTITSIALFALTTISAASSFAAVKSYQVTGEVKEVTPTSITVMKGKEKFEITRDSSTKGSQEVKAGDKVTVYYTMSASEIEAKAAKAKK